MTGRITKDIKTGTYYITIEVGTKGNRKRKVLKNFKTKRDAKVALDQATAELQKEVGNDESKEALSFGDYLDYWLKSYTQSNTSPNTYRGYEQIIRVHLKPGLGHIKLKELRPLQLQN
jgi:Phage integrase, N-terminal SAM-like domain/Arm DNA-binding domain